MDHCAGRTLPPLIAGHAMWAVVCRCAHCNMVAMLIARVSQQNHVVPFPERCCGLAHMSHHSATHQETSSTASKLVCQTPQKNIHTVLHTYQPQYDGLHAALHALPCRNSPRARHSLRTAANSTSSNQRDGDKGCSLPKFA